MKFLSQAIVVIVACAANAYGKDTRNIRTSQASLEAAKSTLKTLLEKYEDFEDLVPKTNYASAQPLCNCALCDENAMAGDYTCGARISYLQTPRGGGKSEVEACSQIGGEEHPNDCGECNPETCNGSSPITEGNSDVSNRNERQPGGSSGSDQKCGAAVNSSNNYRRVCQSDLWGPTGDETMHCLPYGGTPCHLNNNNDPNDGIDKDPSLCMDDTLYLWDEPDTQGKSYGWAGRTWLAYSRRWANELREMRSRGTKVTSPLLKAGGPGVTRSHLEEFMNACGSACRDPSNPAFIDVIAINGFCGPWNGAGGCHAGARFTYHQAEDMSRAFGNIPCYITNWSKLRTHSTGGQVDAIDSIDEFFPSPSSVVQRVYWFGATDYGGGSANNFLTDVAGGRTLGEIFKNKCDSL